MFQPFFEIITPKNGPGPLFSIPEIEVVFVITKKYFRQGGAPLTQIKILNRSYEMLGCHHVSFNQASVIMRLIKRESREDMLW